MDYIRLATPEEIATIADKADLGYVNHTVWALPDEKHGTSLFVEKNPLELDPIFFPPTLPKNHRSMILWSHENTLRSRGVASFYFNIEIKNKEFMESMVHHGAERVSPTEGACDKCGASDIRFKKVIDARLQTYSERKKLEAE